jgi:hypothetical protein
MRTILGVLLAAGLLTGCGGKGGAGDERAEVIPFDQVPPEKVKQAQEHRPGVKFDNARRKADGTYEIRGKDRTGKIYEVEVHPDGKVEDD